MRLFKQIVIVSVMSVLFLASCSEEKEFPSIDGLTNNTPLPIDTVLVGNVPDDAILYFRLSARWEEDASGVYTDMAGTSGTSLSGRCDLQTPMATNTMDCNFKVPEMQLNHSELKFTVGTKLKNSCPVMNFSPYFYQRSADPAFTPQGSTKVFICGAAPGDPAVVPAKECYGGAAPTMIANFPQQTSRYIPSSLGTQFSEILPAMLDARALGLYPFPVSIYAANAGVSADGAGLTLDPVDPRRDFLIAGYRRNLYTVECLNAASEILYTINVTIEDIDEANDHYKDWQN